MKIKEGMYVRTKDDGIQKITKVTTNGCFYRTCRAGFDYKTSLNEEDIIEKPTFEIMELIKPGDVVFDIYGRKLDVDEIKYYPEFDSWHILFHTALYIKKHEIKGILTKEQCEDGVYRIGE